MIKGLLGQKVGMTQIFSATGEAIPVTVVRVGPCMVTQIRTVENDGYNAIQIGFGNGRPKSMTRPELGQMLGKGAIRGLKKDEIKALAEQNGRILARYVREFDADDVSAHQVGEIIRADLFNEGQKVDVSGTSKGRGFAGVVKRHGFRGGPRTHGQSDRLRAPGSIGSGTTPGRVWKGTRMAGRMGGKRVTVQNLEVVKVLPDENLVLLKGSVPGARNGLLMVRRAVKGEK
jgi:large subunit ribosomal protein L3